MWKASHRVGKGERPKNRTAGLSRSGKAAPAIPASTRSRADGSVAAVTPAIAARPSSPSGTATCMTSRIGLPLPQWGTASSAKWEATPAAKALTGPGAARPMKAPDRTWLVTSTPPVSPDVLSPPTGCPLHGGRPAQCGGSAGV